MQRALLSVSDKTGLAELAKALVAAGVELISTGGTRRHLQEIGLAVRDIAEFTGFPEMLDGRVKTLHPRVHGGLLYRRDLPEHVAAADRHEIAPIDLVVVNLYPFEQTVAQQGVLVDEAIEQIDIGGPSMIRSAAKNHASVAVVTRPDQYARCIAELSEAGEISPEYRRQLAREAFALTSRYDAAIAAYLTRVAEITATSERQADPDEDAAQGPAAERALPPPVHLHLVGRNRLRYGENPHQSAALYALPDAGPQTLVYAEQLHGKELSYNNWLDLDAALATVRSLPIPGVAVLKHNNPCGAATGRDVAEALSKAWEGDALSAFGSILGFNVTVDAAAAEYLAEPGKFVEAIIAPDYSPEAVQILTTRPKWKANVRLLRLPAISPVRGAQQLRAIDGGYLAQEADDLPDDPSTFSTPTAGSPSAAQRVDLELAWSVCRHVKSNAIVLVRDGSLVGVGAGQMSRVDAVEIALRKAQDRAQGAALASDAFFPFDDSIHAAAKAGVTSIIQPGGSRNDDQVIAACDMHNLSMLFTGKRHFKH